MTVRPEDPASHSSLNPSTLRIVLVGAVIASGSFAVLFFGCASLTLAS